MKNLLQTLDTLPKIVDLCKCRSVLITIFVGKWKFVEVKYILGPVYVSQIDIWLKHGVYDEEKEI